LERNPPVPAAPAERAAVARALRRAGCSDGVPPRSELLPLLHAVQAEHGWLSRGCLRELADRMGLPFPEVWGVASFYAMFRLEPPAGVRVQVCEDVTCRLRGACLEALQARHGAPRRFQGHAYPHEAEAAAWEAVPCLGRCEHAPVAVVDDRIIHEATFEKIEAARDGRLPGEERAPLPAPVPGEVRRVLQKRSALDRARELGPARILDLVERSGLLGRGGAAFPAAVKWRAVANAAGEKWAVCNADESEPGTFKDRVLMEEIPEVVAEGLRIAMLAVGAQNGLVYVRGEYEEAARRMEGTGLKVFRGAGAYVCGEETALFNSVEGRRGEPRNKPPFPTEHGLFGRPTLVNNVETLANLPLIVLEGPEAFRAYGTERSAGTKLFCVSGHVERPGVYEIPLGTPLGELLRMAGGVWKGRRLQAVLCGGASGIFLGPRALDTPLSFERRTVGSGAIVVLDETASLREMVVRIARFFRDESCGQCVPCRVGTQRQLELLERLLHHPGPSPSLAAEDVTVLRDLAAVMTDASICGLGQTAASAVMSALPLLDGRVG
jgi:NADH-quinone oxidoreductase subunit F